MTAILRPATLGTVFQDHEKRLRALESMGPTNILEGGSITLLSRTLTETALNSSATVPFTSTWQWINATASAAFTLAKPTTVFITSSISYVTTGGTANYGFVRCALGTTLTSTTPSNDINGAPMIGSYGTVTNGAGWTNYSAPFCFTAPAGTYFAAWQYTFNAGATTTMSYGPTEIDLFLMG